MTPEQHRFNSDGSKDWYGSRFAATSEAGKPTLYVPVELLEAALGFLTRCKPFATEKMALEIHKFLETFPEQPKRQHDYTAPRCWCGEANHRATEASGEVKP